MNEPRSERCETCRFWDHDPEDDDPVGLCRRFPPMPLLDIHDNNKAQPSGFVFGGEHPETSADDWCGEWKAAPPSAASAELLAKPIKDICNDARVRKALYRWVCRKQSRLINFELGWDVTVGETIGATANELLEEKNFGCSSLELLRRSLAAHGLALKHEVVDPNLIAPGA